MSARTVRRAFHWAASIYCVTLLVIGVLGVLGLVCWGLWAVLRHLTLYWAAVIAFVAFTFWAAAKIQDDGMAWETDSQSDEVSK